MSRSSSRLAFKTADIHLPPTAVEPEPASSAPALRSKRIRDNSVASSAAGTPSKRGRSSLAGDTPGGTSDSSKRGRKDDLWDDELDRALYAGMARLPRMGRRTIYLEDDDESYGRNGLLGEYLRRQTGRIRNRTQVASHIAVMRKNNPKDQRLVDLSIGHEITPEEFATTHWSALLGPDLHPHTRAAAKAENDKVKRHREEVVLAQKARRSSSAFGGSSPAPRPRPRPRRRTTDGDSDEESDLTDLDDDEPPAAPPSSSAARRRPRASTSGSGSAAAAPTPSSAFHAPPAGSGSGSGTPARRSARRSLAVSASASSPAAVRLPPPASPQRRFARAVGPTAITTDMSAVAEGDDANASPPEAMRLDNDGNDNKDDEAVAIVAASATAADGSAVAAAGSVDEGAPLDADDVDDDVREGAGWLRGVKKGLWRLVGY
ncbi:hypothetical protein JCM3770_006260 [Rhodotorula araucariae]